VDLIACKTISCHNTIWCRCQTVKLAHFQLSGLDVILCCGNARTSEITTE
jgi:hypothetical protein